MIYFTSDFHFNHTQILEYEPRRKEVLGTTIAEHDENLIKRINSRAREHDTLIIVGDLGLSKFSDIKACVDKLVCRHKIMVLGNHDKLSYGQTNRLGFSWVCYETKLKIAGEYVRICHHPYRKPWYKCIFPWQYKEKDRNKRPIDTGNFLIHGHIHSGGHRDGAWRVFKRMINVGVDVSNYYPVSLNEIADLITKTKAKKTKFQKILAYLSFLCGKFAVSNIIDKETRKCVKS